MPDDTVLTPGGLDTSAYIEYTVKRGDSLQSIATEYNTSVAMLIYVNNLTVDEDGSPIIEVGQVLLVPPLAEEPTEEPSEPAETGDSQIITTTSTRGVTVSHPYAKVLISTETGMLTLNQNLAITSENFDGDILSISTVRDIGQDCSTFTLGVVWRRDWYDKIGSNDLIIIALCRPPEAQANVLVGLVDDVRKTTDYSTGKPTRAFNITGRGFNKALMNFVIGTVSELTFTAGVMGFMANMIDLFSGGSPAMIIKEVLATYLGQGCDYNFANGKSFTDYYQQYITQSPTNNEFLADTTSFLTYQGSLWDFLKELKNAPFNEMFWEISNDRPTLVFRPTPFNESDWVKLERVTIKDLDIISENLGRSDLETYVVYKVKAETFAGDTDVTGILPLWYPPYYSKYGLTRLEVYSKYIEYTENGSTQSSTILQKTQDIFNWNIKNNSMENGTLLVKGSNLYHIGARVIIESTGVEYYVENVSHSFTYLTGWTTSLSLTRGLNPADRFTPPWGSSVQMTPADVSRIYGYDVSSVDVSGVQGELGSNYGGGATNVTLTGNGNQDIVDVALAEQGNNEGDGTHTKYIKYYDSSWGAGTAWCACFVTWCAAQAGIPTSVIPSYAGCDSGKNWFKDRGQFQTAPAYGGSSSYVPKAGDIIFFSDDHNMSDSTHTGIVTGSDGTYVYTIEGNTKDMVAKRKYKLDAAYVLGYGVPNY